MLEKSLNKLVIIFTLKGRYYLIFVWLSDGGIGRQVPVSSNLIRVPFGKPPLLLSKDSQVTRELTETHEIVARFAL